VIEGDKVRQIIETFEEENGMPSRLAHTKKVAEEKAAAKQ